MPEGVKYEDLILQADSVFKAFEQEFERFAHFRHSGSMAGVTLDDAEASQRELSELRTRHTGK